MRAVEIIHNGREVLLAGASDAVLISMHVSILVNGDEAASLNVRGMRDLGNERQSRVHWLDELALEEGDELRLKLVSVEEATPPFEDIPTDSEEHLAAQAWYEAEIAADPPKASKPVRKRPNASLEIVVDQEAPIVADLSEDRDLLMLSVTWNNGHPERWGVGLMSTSFEEAIEKTGGRDWFNGHLTQGTQVTVRIGKQFCARARADFCVI